MIDNLATWKSTFAALSSVLDGSWTTNISNWVDDRVTGKANGTELIHAKPPFTFDKATFKTQLDALTVTDIQATAAANIAAAWEVAINTSTYITLPNDYYQSSDPANTWSIVATSLIDPASIAEAKAQMISDITSAPLVDDINNSAFPEIIRNAFLNLTISVTGTNSAVPPVPLNVLATPLL